MSPSPAQTDDENTIHVDGLTERDQIYLETGVKPPTISRATARLIGNIGLFSTLGFIILCVVLSLVDQRQWIPVSAIMTGVSWVTWKLGKTVVRGHDQAEYEAKRNIEIREAAEKAGKLQS